MPETPGSPLSGFGDHCETTVLNDHALHIIIMITMKSTMLKIRNEKLLQSLLSLH